MVYFLGGGIGFGFGLFLMLKICEEYLDRLLSSFCVLFLLRVFEIVIELYNVMLSFYYFVDIVDVVICIDNEVLYYICLNVLKLKMFIYSELNKLVVMIMVGVMILLCFFG